MLAAGLFTFIEMVTADKELNFFFPNKLRKIVLCMCVCSFPVFHFFSTDSVAVIQNNSHKVPGACWNEGLSATLSS